jgi:hypothetical protein
MVSWCLSLRTAFKSLVGVCHYVKNSNYLFLFVISLQLSNFQLMFVNSYSIQKFRLCFSLLISFKLSVGFSHYVQHSNVHLVFVFMFSIKIVSLCSSSSYNIRMFSWCLTLRTAFQFSECVSHYVHHSNGQFVFVITYSIQIVGWCLPLHTAFKWSDGVSH